VFLFKLFLIKSDYIKILLLLYFLSLCGIIHCKTGNWLGTEKVGKLIFLFKTKYPFKTLKAK